MKLAALAALAAALATALAALAIGCDRGHRDAPTPPPVPTPVAPAAPCKLGPITLRYPMPKRLVAIGDLHGDLGGTRAALKTAGAIDDKDQWIGGDLVVVQTGDVLDRGDDEQAIMDLLFRLEGEAKQTGGALIMLIGNHELMNAAGDFRYVTPGGYTDFDDVAGLDTSKYDRVAPQAKNRLAALAPGGLYAKRLANHNVIAIVGDTMFSHAGVLGDWVTQVESVNQSSRCWLDGQAGGRDRPAPAMLADDGPVWTRSYGVDPVDCDAARATLDKLGIKRQVVGHTVQAKGINSVCNDSIWRIDVGLAKLYGGPIEVLELTPGGPPKVLRGTR